MRTIGLLLLVSVVAFGQRAGRGGYGRPYPYGSVSGFGNVVYPGTGHPPPVNRSGAGARIGAAPIVGGYNGIPGGRGGSRGDRPYVYVPYVVGGPWYLPQPEEPAPAAMYPTQQMAPQVVINQNFAPETARPVIREYVSDSEGAIRAYDPPRASAAPAPTEENPTYLIAFKDHTIYAALAYWVENDTLHYITNQNTHNQVSLDLIDRDLSNRFNRERHVDFNLPPAR